MNSKRIRQVALISLAVTGIALLVYNQWPRIKAMFPGSGTVTS